MSLFGEPAAATPANQPLADRMRPQTLDEFVGQEHVIGPGKSLRDAIERGQTGSLILFGPPGVGKTTLARIIAEASGLHFEPFSAVLGGVKEVRAAVARADEVRRHEGRGTMLFVDEIHRFNKAQQDAFLPYVEAGQVVLVGATTENPAFSIIAPLLSRCRTVELRALGREQVVEVLLRAMTDARGLGSVGVRLEDDAAERLAALSGGDARRSLTILEAAANTCRTGTRITTEDVVEAAQHRTLLHDKAGDQHYDLLSAFHKSLRNSDVQAAVYWLARMLVVGVDPMQPARRMMAMAAEDIGLADPMALQLATAALQSVHGLGMPEARLPLTQAAIYLSQAPKSNAVVTAIDAAMSAVRGQEQYSVPLHLRNAVTGLAKDLGHGEGYRYAHDHAGGVAPMSCLPDDLKDAHFYRPSDRGFEAKVAERLAEADRKRRG